MELDNKRRNKLIENPDSALPNVESATCADSKFTGYLFNPENKKGFAKGIAISKRLGYNINNYKELQSEILKKHHYPPQNIGLQLSRAIHMNKRWLYLDNDDPPEASIDVLTDKVHREYMEFYEHEVVSIEVIE